jgi:hypothetical protein
MSAKTKKATFNLHPNALIVLNQAMAKGAAPSKNALVERALIKELKEQQRQSRKSKWEEGTKDPWLLKDLEETETSFQTADAETARKIV